MGRARHDHARRVMITRQFPPPRQTVLSSHELPPRTSFDPSQPSECPFGPRKDWHANRDELRSNRRRTRKPRKSEWAKIESFILCPTFLVPRNVKQRRGNCHNPIFTHRIFSDVDTKNGTALGRASMTRRSLATSNTPMKKVRDTFPKV